MTQLSLKSQAMYLTISQFISFLLTMIIPIILVRLMNQRDFGCYREILFIGSVTVNLMQASLPQSLFYFYPREKTKRNDLITQTMTLLILSSLMGLIIFMFMIQLIGSTQIEIDNKLIILACISFFFESVTSVLEPLFILEARPRSILRLSVILALFRVLTTFGLFLIFQSIIGLVLGLIVLNVGRFIFILGYLRKYYNLRVGFPDRALLHTQIKYSLPLIGSVVIGTIGTQIDKGVITAMMSPEQFAIYSVSSLGILYSITLVCNAIGSVCLPRLSELGGQSDLVGAKELWHKMITTNALLLIPTICFCMVYAEDILTVLYTKKYAIGADVFRVNLLALIMVIVEFGRIPQALGNTKAVFVSNLLRSFVAFFLALILIPYFGLIGGAIGFVLALWVSGGLQLIVSKNLLGLKWTELLPWKPLLSISAISSLIAAALWMVKPGDLSSQVILLLYGATFSLMISGIFVGLKFVDVRSIRKLF